MSGMPQWISRRHDNVRKAVNQSLKRTVVYRASAARLVNMNEATLFVKGAIPITLRVRDSRFTSMAFGHGNLAGDGH